MSPSHRSRGFVVMAVLVLLPLVALAIVIVTSTGQTMNHQTTDAMLRARTHNLAAAALIWLDRNAGAFETTSAPMRELDTSDFGPHSLCRIERLDPEEPDGAGHFRVYVCCTRRRHMVERTFLATRETEGARAWRITPLRHEPLVAPVDPNSL